MEGIVEILEEASRIPDGIGNLLHLWDAIFPSPLSPSFMASSAVHTLFYIRGNMAEIWWDKRGLGVTDIARWARVEGVGEHKHPQSEFASRWKGCSSSGFLFSFLRNPLGIIRGYKDAVRGWELWIISSTEERESGSLVWGASIYDIRSYGERTDGRVKILLEDLAC